ncbi:MAG: NAD(+)/NADH kinase [Lachnospiraceae bacterium]|nr:NAD(+)/NADH kinase [Lachnospiraceae bacterium]
MIRKEKQMNSFLIIANADKDINLELSNNILNYLEEHNAKGLIVSDDAKYYENNLIKDEYLQDVQAIIVLGGDGTMLRAARTVGKDIPFLGINLGTLGFLAEVEVANLYKAIDRLLADDYRIEKRMMIEGRVGDKVYHSLNDIVITRAGFSRIIGLAVYVNGELLDTYEADGVIISTPTGSTGYNLSAGGPIISPRTKAIVVTPISPHSFSAKSVVFDSLDNISVEIVKKRKTQDTEAIVSFDGDNNMELSAGDVVNAGISSKEVSLIKMYDVNFYSVLRDKIGGRE